jgi:hypothetical protein
MRPLRMMLMCLLLVLVAGCGGETALNPAFQPQVSNQPDNFQFQSTGVTGVTQTLQYTWQNTGTTANVNQATTVAAGSATLTIRDASGTQVYTLNLADNGTFATNAGASGDWTIQIVLSSMSGTLNFRVQKP